MKKWMIAAVVILVLAIGFVWLYNPFKPPAPAVALDANKDNNPIDENTEYVFGQIFAQDPYLDQFQTLDDCAKASGSDKTDCLFEVAKKTNDISVCNSVGDLKQWCQSNLFVQSHDTQKCASLGQAPKNQCYYDIGKKFLELNPCQKISDSQMQNECIRAVAIGKSDYQICRQMPSTDGADNCIAIVAEMTDNPALCDQITNADNKVDCQNIFTPEPLDENADIDLSFYDNIYAP
ncbi:MAG: hypothetical protein V1777_04175 [Candidatus Micrarchaeota archaeon]